MIESENIGDSTETDQGEIETLKRFTASNFTPTEDLGSNNPTIASLDVHVLRSRSNQALADGRQAILRKSQALLNKRRAELYLDSRERKNGPQGEMRSAVLQQLELIPIELILEDPNFKNVRLEVDKEALAQLSESIKHEGLKIPITVIPSPDGNPNFYVRAGFRRLRVIKALKWKNVPAIILPLDTPVIEEHWINIIENSARSGLSSYEVACAAQTMRDKFKIKPAEFALRAGYSESHVNNLLRSIDKLPEEVVDEWKGKAPIPLVKYFDWSKMTHSEAIKHMLVYKGRYPQVTRDWHPSTRLREKAHPIRMASTKGLTRMMRVRFAIESARCLDDTHRRICLDLVDYCSGAREDVPQIFRPKRNPAKQDDLPLADSHENAQPLTHADVKEALKGRK